MIKALAEAPAGAPASEGAPAGDGAPGLLGALPALSSIADVERRDVLPGAP